MIRVRTKVRVAPGGRLEAEIGEALAPGEHEVEIVAEDASPPLGRAQVEGMKVFDRAWPEGASLRRADMYGDDGR